MSPINLNKQLADAICTIVTLGFMEKETTKTGSKTIFAYEKNDEKDAHERLTQRINTLSSKQIVSFQQMDDKLIQPFVIAQTKKMVASSRQSFSDLVNNRNHLLQIISDNSNNDVHFYGAYISGCIKGDNTVELSETSSLKLYGRPDGTQGWIIEGLDNSVVMNSYNTAKDITNTVNEFLKKHLKDHNTFCNIKFILQQEEISKPKDFIANCLFGSIHGLVKAIIRYNLTDNGIGSDTLATCCELALSNDTTKVASCIPCSIFASSNKTPAPYTHLGRGDNWNFPDPDTLNSNENATLSTKRNVWNTYVSECFDLGLNLLTTQLPDELRALSTIQNFNKEQKGEIFLHSLTFEDKFINRMNNTFNILNIY